MRSFSSTQMVERSVGKRPAGGGRRSEVGGRNCGFCLLASDLGILASGFRPFGVGEEEYLAGAAHQFEGLSQGGVGGNGQNSCVQSPLSKVQSLFSRRT